MIVSSSRIAALSALTGAAVLALAAPASAHVSVEPQQAEKGGYSKVVFKVPNERDNASTTKVEVNLPADHPVASVQTTPVPGWKAKVTRSKLDKPLKVHGEEVSEAVTKVTWSGGKIKPGTFQEFPISVGPLPEDTDSMVFKTLQTYEGGEVARWIEEPKKGEEEPEEPAPVLALTAPSEGGHDGGAAGEDTEEQASETSSDGAGKSAEDDADDSGTEETAASSSDTTARTLGIVGIVVGVAGAALGLLGMRRGASGGRPTA